MRSTKPNAVAAASAALASNKLLHFLYLRNGQSSSRRARLWPFFLSGIAHGANGRNVRYFYCARNFLAMRNIHETRATYANLIRRGDALGVPRPWPTRISIA